ncbi:O-succinylbenzoate--CoA ligase (plasmid) [Rhodococcus opacus]|uniref:O-succinylbenzoate--CoA ligase n=2 Tax=Rhodococcus opacus TaxID=37919 RepID=A0A076F582_RHOOP|nr:O-succinylbenzoate--CoA ligase [Rhodococcus opacus]
METPRGGIADWITRRAERAPDHLALIDADSDARVSYLELHQHIADTAAALRTLGVRRGDRVVMVMDNSIEFLTYLFATAALGAVAVPVNFRLAAPEIAYILEDSRPEAVVHSDRLTELTASAVATASTDVRTIVNADAPSDVVADRSAPAFERVDDDDVCLIMYTSGTTGHPKGAMITHGHLRWNAINMVMVGGGLSSNDITVTVAPLFHIGALGLLTTPLLYVGGTVVLQKTFSPAGTLAAMAKYRATVGFLVPAMWAALSQVENFVDYDVSAVRFVMSGGAPCPLPVIRFYQAKGWAFLEGFGMTEFGPSALLLDNDHIVSHAGTVGRPFLHTDVAVVDDDDRPVLPGEVGELILRGPTTFAGYWGLPEQSEAALRGGWFHSGDLARIAEDGFVTLVDRKKDMIISGGENVYPIEVEQALYTHPAIADVAVIGVPDHKWGEAVTAVVVLRPDAVADAGELIEFTRSRIAHFKSPKRVVFTDELPRNATGKLLKRALREKYTGTAEAVTR